MHQQNDSRCCYLLILPSDVSGAAEHVSTPLIQKKKKTGDTNERYVKDTQPQLQHTQHTSHINTELITQINGRRLGGHITTNHFRMLHYITVVEGFAGVPVHPPCSTLLCSNRDNPAHLSLCSPAAKPSALNSCPFVPLASFPGFHSNHIVFWPVGILCIKEKSILWLNSHKMDNILFKCYPANAWHETTKHLTSSKLNSNSSQITEN